MAGADIRQVYLWVPVFYLYLCAEISKVLIYHGRSIAI